MYDVRANKKNELIHILASLNKYDDFIVVEAIEVEDQNAIKIDEYFLFFGLGLGSLSPSSIKSFWEYFCNDRRKAIKVPSSGSLIKIFLLFKDGWKYSV